MLSKVNIQPTHNGNKYQLQILLSCCLMATLHRSQMATILKKGPKSTG
jgi:hypothetical protein